MTPGQAILDERASVNAELLRAATIAVDAGEVSWTREVTLKLDGIRLAEGLLREERLLAAESPDQLRDALRILRIAQTVAEAVGQGQVAAGVLLVRSRIATLIEASSDR